MGANRGIRRVAALLAVSILVLAACGSDGDDEQGARNGQGGGQGVTADDLGGTADQQGSEPGATGDTPGAAPGGGTGGSGGGGGSSGGSGSGTGGGTGTGGGGPRVTTGGRTPTPGQLGPGVSATTIKVGLTYDKNAGALNRAYGFAGLGQVDQKQVYDLLIKHINANGGVAGRKLQPVYYVTDQLANKSPEQTAQEACATWTQDNKIFAAWAGAGNPAQAACLTKAGVVQVGPGFGEAFKDTFKRFPYLVDTSDPAQETIGRLVVDQMVAQGFYKKARPEAVGQPIRIGLMAHDLPAFRAGAAAMKAALARHGLKLAEEVYVTKGETADSIPSEANAVQAAVLRFKERGITHVHFLQTSNAFAGLTFWTNAEKLQYFPRYGLTSLDGAQALSTTLDSSSGSGSARRQFKMAIGAGWHPLLDVPRADYTGQKESAELRRCKQIAEPASEGGWNDAARNKETIAGTLCDAAFYFKAALEAGGAVPNAASWLAGVAKITNLGSATTFGFRTTRQRDAVGSARVFAFSDDCSCFHYKTAPDPV